MVLVRLTALVHAQKELRFLYSMSPDSATRVGLTSIHSGCASFSVHFFPFLFSLFFSSFSSMPAQVHCLPLMSKSQLRHSATAKEHHFASIIGHDRCFPVWSRCSIKAGMQQQGISPHFHCMYRQPRGSPCCCCVWVLHSWSSLRMQRWSQTHANLTWDIQ